MEKKLYTLIVYSENIAGLLNQVTAVFTRRQINIESLNVSASSIQGVHKYTITAWTDGETIVKVVRQIEKKIEVIQAHYFTDDEIFYHEIALYKLSTPKLESDAYISKVIRRYGASIVEVNPVFTNEGSRPYSVAVEAWHPGRLSAGRRHGVHLSADGAQPLAGKSYLCLLSARAGRRAYV